MVLDSFNRKLVVAKSLKSQKPEVELDLTRGYCLLEFLTKRQCSALKKSGDAFLFRVRVACMRYYTVLTSIYCGFRYSHGITPSRLKPPQRRRRASGALSWPDCCLSFRLERPSLHRSKRMAPPSWKAARMPLLLPTLFWL